MERSSYRTMAEAFIFGGLSKIKLPTNRVDYRRLTVEEIKQCIAEEFDKAKSAADVNPEERPGGWGDKALAKEIEWIKKLDLKEVVFGLKRDK